MGLPQLDHKRDQGCNYGEDTQYFYDVFPVSFSLQHVPMLTLAYWNAVPKHDNRLGSVA
jgi:hypothetical protein